MAYALVLGLPLALTILSDHQGLFPPYFASEESLTLDGIVRGDKDEVDRKHPPRRYHGLLLIFLKDGPPIGFGTAPD